MAVNGDSEGNRGRAASALGAARDRTASAYEAARNRAGDVTRKATDQMALYPIGAVIGGFVVGALVGALIPRTQTETKALGKTGRKLTGAAKEAAQRGLDAGREQLGALRAKAAERVSEAVADVVSGAKP